MVAIMAKAHIQRPRRWGIIQPPAFLALMGVASLMALVGDAGWFDAVAQEVPSANQPLAIDGAAALVPSPCKLVVPPGQSVLQPLKIRPDQVPLKNRLGCLSPADALYGPDGCPVRLCGPTKGVFPLTP
jgi:hypothetical protein